jgi:hypothetical protein
MTDSSGIIWVRHVAIGNKRNAYKVLVGNSAEKIQPEDLVIHSRVILKWF